VVNERGGGADACKPAAGVAAVHIAFDRLFEDGTEEPVLFLESGLVFLKERVKVMEKHPAEHGTFWMSGAIDSCRNREP